MASNYSTKVRGNCRRDGAVVAPDSFIQLWVPTALGHCKAAWNEAVLPDRLGAARTGRTVLGPRQKKFQGIRMRVCRILHTRATLGGVPSPHSL